MTMGMKNGVVRLLAWFLAIVAGVGALSVADGSAGYADSCLRTVSIDPQVSAGEGAGTLTLVVHTRGCAAAGGVAYAVMPGSARPNDDFQLANGYLQWPRGDLSDRSITAVIVPNGYRGPDIRNFTVRLVGPTPSVHVANGVGEGRILDDDGLQIELVIDDVICPVQGLVPFGDVGHDTIDISCPPTLHVSTPATDPVAAHWETVDGTARAGVDFVGVVDGLATVEPGTDTTQLALTLLPRPPGTPPRSLQIRVTTFTADGVVVVDAVATLTLGGF